MARTAADVALGLDQGTGSSRAILVTQAGRVVAEAAVPVRRTVHRDDAIDQDAEACVRALKAAVARLWEATDISPARVRAVGLAVQRSTSVLFAPAKGRRAARPLAPAISWQCTRTRPWMERAFDDASRRALSRSTGLPVVPGYAASKLRWLLKQHRPAKSAAWQIGTLDSYILARLTGRTCTDLSQATRTLLVDLRETSWSPNALARFGLPASRLPEVVPTVADVDAPHGFLHANALPGLGTDVPVTASAGDQQASLFGSGQRRAGQAKLTYGTGAFLLAHAGHTPPNDAAGVIRSVGWSTSRTVDYVLETNVPSAGSVIRWLESLTGRPFSDLLCEAARDRRPLDEVLGSLRLIPSFAGLGPASSVAGACGLVEGLGHGDDAPRLGLALATGIGCALRHGLDALEQARGGRVRGCVVDGGGARDARFLSIQSSVLRRTLRPLRHAEGTAFGAAALAWAGLGAPAPHLAVGAPTRPALSASRARRLQADWTRALRRLENQTAR